MKLVVAKWASIAAAVGPNTPVMLSRIKLPELLLLEPPLDIFILTVDIAK